MLGGPFLPYDAFAYREPKRRVPFMAPPRPRRAPKAPIDPVVDTATTSEDYIIRLAPPSDGFDVKEASAELIGARTIELTGAIASRARLCTYQTLRPAAVYSEPVPSRHTLIGYVAAGAIVKGSPPSHGGWVALEDDESWMIDDGALALVEAPREPEHFARRVSLPADALVERATSERPRELAGGLLITVPRSRMRPTQMAAPPPQPAPRTPRDTRHAPVHKTPKKTSTSHHREPPPPAPTPARPAKAQARHNVTPSLHDELRKLSSEEPVLCAVIASASNVKAPSEEVESWLAVHGGGFVRSP